VASFLPVLAPPTASALWPSGVVELHGHGWGHGRGLGQYGALGYAVDDGWSAAQILDRYYGGTTAGAQANAEITVRLSDFDDRDLIMTSGLPFRVGPHLIAAGQAALVSRAADGWVIKQASTCGGPVWTTIQAGIPLTEEPGAAVVGDPGDDISKMLIACGTNSRSYRGRLKIVTFGDGSRVVNTVLMESCPASPRPIGPRSAGARASRR
jgi:hypothetical protein